MGVFCAGFECVALAGVQGAMPQWCKRSPQLRFEYVAAQKHSTLGGLPALEALAQEFDLWNKLRALPGLVPRTRTAHGYSPELIVAQFLYCFCSGGASRADAERLNDEPLVRELARVDKFADQSQFGERLRAQSAAAVAVVCSLIAEFIAWVITRADAARWTYAGRAEAFFDDTQIEVHGPTFEGAKINYNGQLALSWQTLWWGPFLRAGELGSPADVSAALPGIRPAPHCPWWPYVWSQQTRVRVGDDGQVPVGAQRQPIEAPPRSTFIRCLRPDGDIYYLRHAPDLKAKPIVLLHCPVF